jgi:hypothetical protein
MKQIHDEIDRRMAENRSDCKTFAGMTPEKKILLSIELYWAARELMAAGLRARKPGWTEDQVQDVVRRTFLNGAG